MDFDQPTTVTCSLLAIDHTNLYYRACSICERTLPDTDHPSSSLCKLCNSPSPPSKRLFRILVSIATDTKVKVVICFDRTSRVLFGCSADEFFHFAKLNPFAALTASTILEGEMVRMTLAKPKKNTSAQHLRVSSVLPLRTGFRPVMETLREHYRGRVQSLSS